MPNFLKFFLIFLLLLLFVFRSLVFNIGTNLIDWFDYPLILWIMHQSISKIISLDFSQFFNTNAFYPYSNTLFFSDLLLPQAVMAIPFYLISRNLILSFNLIFLITFILNYVGSFLLWRKIFKDDQIAFVGSLLLVFSPFFHLELSHFQMLSFWPSAFCLYFMLDREFSLKKSLAAGIFLTLQFLSAVYLAAFLLVSILVFYFLKIITLRKLSTLKSAFVILAVFAVISLPFLKGYSDTKKMYGITRDIREYIQYSAHLSDYLFTNSINSIIHRSPPMNTWNNLNKHFIGVLSSFPGFLIFSLALIGLFTMVLKKRELLINLRLNQERAFFAILLFLGFILSLGPRLNFNGNYAHIPLPFVLYKILPFLEVTRAPARWSFIFYLALIYFALVGFIKLKQRFPPGSVVSLVLVIFFLEYIPVNLKTSAQNYIDFSDQILAGICSKEKKVLLEIPVTHLDAAPNIMVGLNYITKVELASTYHKCYLVNGYSGYDLPQVLNFRDRLYKIIESENIDAFLVYLKESEVDIVQFNTTFFIEELKEPVSILIENLKRDPRVTLIENAMFMIK